MEAVFGPPEEAPRRPRRDDEFECEIEGFDAKGLGLGVAGTYAVRMRRALPGERVRARVQKRRRFALEGQVLERLAPSPDAVPARCPHTADCGGCSFQELGYARQLLEKRELARRLLAPLAEALGQLDVPAVTGAESTDRYRNKMDFTFGDQRWTETVDDGRPVDFALGLHSPRRWEKVLDVRRCVLAPAWNEELLRVVRELSTKHALAPWSVDAHTGFLRNLVLREGSRTGERMAYLVTSEGEPEGWPAFLAELLEQAELTTLVHGVTSRLSTVAIGDTERVVHGPGVIHDELCGVRFRVSPTSFFQTHTAQAERLVELARSMLQRAGAGGGVLYDLYCGAGTFGLSLAGSFEQVVGLELVGAAVADARANAEANGIGNARFEAGDVLQLMAGVEAGGLELPAADAAVIDPPRAGLHADVAGRLAQVGPPVLVYVSCNLAAAARDLELLCAERYALAELALVDLFPHTPHLEGVFALRAR